MDSFIHADIFFFVTTIATIVLGILAAIVLYYIAHIARTVRDIAQVVKDQTENVSQDIDMFRTSVKDKTKSISDALGAARKIFVVNEDKKVAKKKAPRTKNAGKI